MSRFLFVRGHALDPSDGLDAYLVDRLFSSIMEVETATLSTRILKSPPEKHAATILHVAADGHPDGLVVDGDGSSLVVVNSSDFRGFIGLHRPSLLVLVAREPGAALAREVAGTCVPHVVLL